jgi:O-antigen ligase
MPAVLHESLLWGYGPGLGYEVSRRFTKEGKPWHSLYLLVGAETGVPGMMALLVLLGMLAVRGVRHLRASGEIVPLMALLSFAFIGVSVSGIDAISGVFLGYAFGGGDFTGFRRVRIGVAAVAAKTAEGAETGTVAVD